MMLFNRVLGLGTFAGGCLSGSCFKKKKRCRISYLFYHLICLSSFVNVHVELCRATNIRKSNANRAAKQLKKSIFSAAPFSLSFFFFFICKSLWELCQADVPLVVCSAGQEAGRAVGQPATLPTCGNSQLVGL